MNTIQMATTDELVEELFRRHDAALVVLEKDADGDESQAITPVGWKGSRAHALGLAGTAESVIRAAITGCVQGEDGEAWE